MIVGLPWWSSWLELYAVTVEGLGSIPGQGTRIPQAVRRGQKKKKV